MLQYPEERTRKRDEDVPIIFIPEKMGPKKIARFLY